MAVALAVSYRAGKRAFLLSPACVFIIVWPCRPMLSPDYFILSIGLGMMPFSAARLYSLEDESNAPFSD